MIQKNMIRIKKYFNFFNYLYNLSKNGGFHTYNDAVNSFNKDKTDKIDKNVMSTLRKLKYINLCSVKNINGKNVQVWKWNNSKPNIETTKTILQHMRSTTVKKQDVVETKSPVHTIENFIRPWTFSDNDKKKDGELSEVAKDIKIMELEQKIIKMGFEDVSKNVYDDLYNRYDNLLDDYNNLKNVFNATQTENLMFSDQVSDQFNKLKQKDNVINELETLTSKLNNQLTVAINDNKMLNDENTELKEWKHETQIVLMMNEQNTEKLFNENAKLQNHINALHTEMEQKNTSISEKDKRITVMTEECLRLEKMLDDIKKSRTYRLTSFLYKKKK